MVTIISYTVIILILVFIVVNTLENNMEKKKWGIKVNGDTWMSDGHWMDENGDWHDHPAVYDTATEAKKDAAEFGKGSNHTYVAEVYKENNDG